MNWKMLTLGFVFVFAGEALAGAKMNFVGPKSHYARAGLETGDIVMNIDGVEPKSATDVGGMLHDRLNDGKKHKIEVVRKGKKQILEF